MKRRDTKFFDKCIEAQVNQNRDRAILYANECAEIRKLAKLILSSEVALEKAIIRLETISELSDVVGAVGPILGIVRETQGRLKGIVPSVSGKLEEVTGILNTSMTKMGSVCTSVPSVRSLNREAEQILEDANVAAENKIREKFPQLPAEFHAAEEAHATEEAGAKIPVALTASGVAAASPEKASLKKEVYRYIKDREGDLSVVQCASYLGVFPVDVEKAILGLKQEGKIVLEEVV